MCPPTHCQRRNNVLACRSEISGIIGLVESQKPRCDLRNQSAASPNFFLPQGTLSIYWRGRSCVSRLIFDSHPEVLLHCLLPAATPPSITSRGECLCKLPSFPSPTSSFMDPLFMMSHWQRGLHRCGSCPAVRSFAWGNQQGLALIDRGQRSNREVNFSFNQCGVLWPCTRLL